MINLQSELIPEPEAREIHEWLESPTCDKFVACLRAEAAARASEGLQAMLDDAVYFIHKTGMNDKSGPSLVAAARLKIAIEVIESFRKPEAKLTTVAIT